MTAERWRRSLTQMGHTVKTVSSQSLDANALSREIADFRPDVIHAHHALKAGALLLEKPIKEAIGSIPFVISPAGTDINQDQASEGILKTFLNVCRASRRIITQSPWMLKRTIARRWSTKFAGLVIPSRWMSGPSGFCGSGHQ